jgi:hypothetical protein
MRADYEAWTRSLRSEPKGKAAPPAGWPEPKGTDFDPRKEDPAGGPGGEKGAPTAIRLRHAEAADIVRVAERLLAGTGGRVTHDAASNTLFVTGPAGAVADVEKVVAALDAGPEGKK